MTLLVVCTLLGLLVCQVAAATAPNIWPLPQQYSNGDSDVTLSANFLLSSPAPFNDLNAVLSRYGSILFPHKASSSSLSASAASLSGLVVTVSQPNATLQLGTDESYTLKIPVPSSTPHQHELDLIMSDDTHSTAHSLRHTSSSSSLPPSKVYVATLSATTLAGAIRGLETFAQLVVFNFTLRLYQIHQAPWSIYDFPSFSHRGILLDTSRHFQPISNLRIFIDSLAMAKLNTFHWHLSDTESFPFESISSPLLWTAAYSEQDRYSQADVADIVEYARLRGVRVMIEVDVPGHAAAMCKGYPNICPSKTCLQPIDPSQDETFARLTNLFQEMTGGALAKGLFPETLFHLGGDEVDTTCWSTTSRVAKWMSSQNMTADDAYMYVVERAHTIIQNQGRDPVNWDEVWEHFGTKLDKRTIIHNWRDKRFVAEAAEAGYRVIVSNSDVWYLDHLDVQWQQFYENDPLENISDPAAQKFVIGGETCMWGETVDASDLFATVWPRAAAAAERLWSANGMISNTNAALPRLEYFRCYMDQRGVGAAPVNNANARSAPNGAGACLVQ